MVSETQKLKKELRKNFPELNMKRKYFIYDIEKIGYLDIETTNLDANFGFMLSWAMYVRDVQNEKKNYIVYDCITEKDIKAAVNRGRIDMDKRILKSLFVPGERRDDLRLPRCQPQQGDREGASRNRGPSSHRGLERADCLLGRGRGRRVHPLRGESVGIAGAEARPGRGSIGVRALSRPSGDHRQPPPGALRGTL